MLSPREENKIMSRIDRIDQAAYSILFEKYIVKNLKGEKKLTEIDSTDQEGLIAKRNGGYPIPGCMYTFIYGGPDAIIEMQKGGTTIKKEYTDLVPLIFCINNDRGWFSGINMNALPPDVRLDFMQSFYETFKEFFLTADTLAENNKEAINKRFISFVKSGGGQTMIKLFSRRDVQNYNFGYRKYLIEKVDRLRMVEYTEWKYLPFYEPKNAFRKMNQSQLYNLYRGSLNNRNI